MDKFLEKLKRWFHVSDLKTLAVYWACFAAVIIYWELLIKAVTGELLDGGFFFLCFVPAEALFFTALVGWGREMVNRILVPVLMLLMAVYYIIQVGYYKIFGSLLSVALLGMGGAAVDDFGWTVGESLQGAIGIFALILLPVLLAYSLEFWLSFPGKDYCLPAHLCAVPAVILLWCLGIGILTLGGTSRQSAYYAFTNRQVDTDTASRRLGASATTLVETSAWLFGVDDGNGSDLSHKDPSALLGAESPAPTRSPAPTAPQPANSGEPAPTPTPTPEPKFHALDAIDFKVLGENASNDTVKALCSYYDGVAAAQENDYTGLCKDYNLIYICAEGYWTYAANEKATPTLWKMQNNGIVLTNYYNSFKNTTTNGEFAFVCGLWPDMSMRADSGSTVGSFPQSATKYMPYGLGNVTASSGYSAYGYHNFKGSYYGRNKSHTNLGLTCKFMNSGMKFTTAWPSSDFEMMKQSVDDFINEDKFVAYYMTFSGHGPYNDENLICKRNWDETVAAVEGMGYDEYATGYLSCNRELDKALEYLLQRLEEAGKADNTLIVLTGDHYPYYMTAKSRKTLMDHKYVDEFDFYKSSCIMYCPGIKEPIYNDVYCCNVDILPTVLNLLDIPYDSRMLAGTDVFSDGLHKAVLYNKSFVTSLVKYDASKGKTEWLSDVSAYTQDDLDGYIDAICSRIDTEFSASLKTMSSDFYRYVWENSGLMPQESGTG